MDEPVRRSSELKTVDVGKTIEIEPAGTQAAIESDRHDRTEHEPPPRPQPRSASPWAGLARTGIIGAVVIVVLLGGLLIVLNAAGNALNSLNPFRDGVIENRTIDRSGHAVVRSITELGQLKAATGHYEVVVDVEKDVKPLPSFLAGERILFVAVGSADATVDLSGLDEDAIVMNDDRTAVTVTVPAPVVGKPALDLERSHVFAKSRGALSRLGDLFGDGTDGDDPTSQEAVYKEGSRRIGQAAVDNPDLVTDARNSATATLTSLMHGLGFTDVTVVFEKPDQR
jgi:hypothetical protein